MSDRCWWPSLNFDIYLYVQSVVECQFSTNRSPYKINFRLPLTNNFKNYSIDFSGPFPASKTHKRFISDILEHLTGWPITKAAMNVAFGTVIQFLEDQIIYYFGFPVHNFSENGLCFPLSKLIFLLDGGALIGSTPWTIPEKVVEEQKEWLEL